MNLFDKESTLCSTSSFLSTAKLSLADFSESIIISEEISSISLRTSASFFFNSSGVFDFIFSLKDFKFSSL